MKDSIFIGKIWFESFHYHFKKRKVTNQLKHNSEEEYIQKIKSSVLNYQKVFYMNERNGYGKWIDKLYFFTDNWVTIFKFNNYDFKIITSFKLEHENYVEYLRTKGNLFLNGEVKNENEYQRIIKEIQRRIRS